MSLLDDQPLHPRSEPDKSGLPALRVPTPEASEPIDVEVHVLGERRLTDWVGVRLAVAKAVRSSLGLIIISAMALAAVMLVQGSSVLSGGGP